MRRLTTLFIILLLSVGLYAQKPKVNDSEIIDKIIAKYSKIYEQYEGVMSVKHLETKVLDSESKELQKTKKVKLNERNYFYQKSTGKAFEYYEDGKKKDPDDYKSGKQSKPIIPVFDKDSKKNYTINIVGSKTHRKVDCYKLKVIPKRKSETLFKGDILVSKKTLSVMYLKGTISEFSKFMEDFQLKIDYKTDKFPSESVGEVLVHIDVPIFFSDKLIKNKFKTFKPVPIKK